MVVRLEPSTPFPIFPEYDLVLQYEMMKALGPTAVPAAALGWSRCGTAAAPRAL